MDTPTVEQIRTWSNVDFEALNYGDDERLQVLVNRAKGWLEKVTGRKLDSLPSELDTLAGEAIQMWVEHTAMATQEDVIETAADFDLIQNFSVTGYSETRRSADDARKAKMIHPWPRLHDLAWQLATEDKQDEWLEDWGMIAPAFEVTEVDWSETTELPARAIRPGDYPYLLE